MGAEQWVAAGEIARRQFGVLSLRQLQHELGVTRSALAHAVQRGRLERMFESAYRLPGSSDWRQRAMAATLVAGQGCAISHQSAGALYKLSGLEKFTTPIHVSMPERRPLSLPEAFVVHRPRHPFLVSSHQGIPTTSITRTLVDLASVLDEEALEFALDDAQHKFRDLGRQLEHTLGHLKAQYPGIAALRELVRIRAGRCTESPLELRLWRVLRKVGLDPPCLQFKVFHEGRYIMRVDFVWPEHRIALHADSFLWHARRNAFDHDARQRSQLAALGWVNLFATERSLTDPKWFDDLRRVIRSRDPQLPLALSGTEARVT
jgi:very-short-patch-repair endonuclease